MLPGGRGARRCHTEVIVHQDPKSKPSRRDGPRVRHNRPMSMPDSDPAPRPADRQRWRCPAVLRVKAAVFAGAGAVIALVFFPLWFAVPVAALLAAYGLGLAVRAATVELDPGRGLLVLRVGLITRRVRLTDITAVLVDRAKVSVARSGGGEISLYAWRKSALDGWLGVPAVADDIGHAVASAVALACDSQDGEQEPAVRSGSSARARSALATALLGGAGLVALVSAFLVRLSWPDPAMTIVSVLLALALGITGLFYVVFACWLLLPRRSVPV